MSNDIQERREGQKELLEVLHRLERSLESKELSDLEHRQHHEYIATVLEREATRSAFRKAIIEKTLASLVWSGIAAAAAWVVNFISTHYKP